jgi:Domain of unknown function (DUF4258)
LKCERLVFTGHVIQRMFERGIGKGDVQTVVAAGATIEDYPHDTPLPSRLVLGFVGERPIHAVVAIDSAAAVCIVVTVYEPQPDQWEADFRRRRAK